jgi:hypothetical protein
MLSPLVDKLSNNIHDPIGDIFNDECSQPNNKVGALLAATQ